ncbi:MAG TPA: hypothetical protein VIA80_11080 [Hyphomonadaceae bacterium]
MRSLFHVAKGALAASVLLLAPIVDAQAPKREEWKPETFELANGMKAVVLPDHRRRSSRTCCGIASDRLTKCRASRVSRTFLNT